MLLTSVVRRFGSALFSLLGCLLCAVSATASPSVTLQSPTRNVVAPGEGVTLSVSATGSGALTYQWLHKGKAIPGATGNTLAIANASYADSGWYLVDVTDTTGITRSKPVFALVAPTKTQTRYWNGNAYPGNEYTDFDEATDIISVAPGSTHSVALRRSGDLILHGHSGSYAGYPQLPASGDYVEIGVGQYSTLGLRSDGVLAEVFNSYRTGSPTMNGLTDVVAIASADLHALALKSNGTVVAWGNNGFGQCNVPSGLTDVVAIACSYYNSYALKSDGTLVIWGDNYSGVVSQSGLGGVAAIACSSSHFVAIKSDGTAAAFGRNGAGQCNVPMGLTGAMVAAAGTVYSPGDSTGHSLALREDGTVMGWGYGTPAGPLPSLTGAIGVFAQYGLPIVIRDASADTVPIITTAPLTQTKTEGMELILTVSATGTAPGTFSFQWRKNGAELPGATSTSLVFANLQPADAGSYDVVVTNYLGSTASASANITVHPGSVSNLGSTRRVVRPGHDLDLGVIATGAGTLTYQWTRNGIPVSGANGSSYSHANVTFNDSGWYNVLVTDDYGTRRSAPFFVSVAPFHTQVTAWESNVQGATNVPVGLTTCTAVATGYSHALALKADGTVVRWGLGAYGLDTMPAGLSDVAAIAAGPLGALALKADGTVIGWGGTGYGEGSIPPSLGKAVAIAQGYGYSLAIRNDGSVAEWGGRKTGVPAGLTNVMAIAAGDNHSLVLKNDGTVTGWGLNDKGQTNIPSGLSNVIAIAAGYKYSLALKQDGTVVAWGDNSHGETSIPAGLNGVISISARSSVSYAVKVDGTVIAWGDNSAGQRNIPAGLDHVFQVSDGAGFALALRDAEPDLLSITRQPANQASSETQPATFAVTATGNGTALYQWRKNGANITGATLPTLILSDLKLDDAGSYDVVITNYLGSVTSNAATLTVNPSPTITNLSPARQVLAAGQTLDLAVEATGTGPLSYQWTHNGHPIPDARGSHLSRVVATRFDGGYYQVYVTDNLGTRRSAAIFLTLTDIPSITNIRRWGADGGAYWFPFDPTLHDAVAVDAGPTDALVLRSNGTVAGWGQAIFGEVIPPNGLHDVVAVSAASGFSIALKKDGSLVAWGSLGNAAPPAGLDDVVSVSIGSGYVLALRSNGTISAWGNNAHGECNIPTGLFDVVAVAAGGYFPIALKGDGTVVTWGQYDDYVSSFQPTPLPTNLTDVVAIDCSGLNSMALKRDGTVVAWGVGYTGVNDIPAGLKDVVSISIGIDYALALKANGAVIGWGRNDQGGQLPVPGDLNNVVAISCGGFSTALQSAPVLTEPLPDRILIAGSSFSLTVNLFGSGPFTYQWQRNLVDIPGATEASLTFAELKSSDAGAYRVVVTNSIGSATSNVGELVVNSVPAVTSQPANQKVYSGQGAVFAVAATGKPVPSYQWQVLILGADSWIDLVDGATYTGSQTATLHLTHATVATDDGDQYRCVVSNSAGSAVSAPATLTVKVFGPDLDGNGWRDILWRNPTSGELAVWCMEGPTRLYSLSLGTSSPLWQTAGTGEFNEDGQVDILWRNPTSGELAVWIMNGSMRQYSLSLGTSSPLWQTAGTGDFNGDGKMDILWRNPTSGELAVWIMNGTMRQYSLSLGSSSPLWQTAGTGDFNGDGKMDILWRNPTSGELAVWIMNGTTREYSLSLGTSSPLWQTSGTGDFNGDGQVDILWRNPTGGELAVWIMNGTTRQYSLSLGSSSPLWQVSP